MLPKDRETPGTRRIAAGDLVVIYEGYNSMRAVYVEAKGAFNNRYGRFPHADWIGKEFGSRVFARAPGHGWVLLLAPSAELWSAVLPHRTQILYLADISLVVGQLELRPGSVVLESGTGSGSLTHSLARAVAPTGHVHTFEFHSGRAEQADAEFKRHGLESMIAVQQRNIEEAGFPEALHGQADAIFLDLPGPHRVVPSARACLKPDGVFCSFSPCIEQVQRTCEVLSQEGFVCVQTLECLLRSYDVQQVTLDADPAAPPPAQPRRKRARDEGGGSGNSGAASAAAAGEAEESEAGAAAPAAAAEAEASAAAEALSDASAEAAAAAAAGAAAEAGAAEAAAAAAATQTAAAAAEANGRRVPGAVQQMVVARPAMEARGHTGYLTFARKFVAPTTTAEAGA